MSACSWQARGNGKLQVPHGAAWHIFTQTGVNYKNARTVVWSTLLLSFCLFSLSLSLPNSLLLLSFSFSFSSSLTFFFSLSLLSFALSPSLALSVSLSLSRSPSPSLAPSLSLPLSRSLFSPFSFSFVLLACVPCVLLHYFLNMVRLFFLVVSPVFSWFFFPLSPSVRFLRSLIPQTPDTLHLL